MNKIIGNPVPTPIKPGRPGETEWGKRVEERLRDLEEETVGGGISKEEKRLIMALLEGAAYIADMSEKVEELKGLWFERYRVNCNLTGVTANNETMWVTENDAYTIEFTAKSGYTMDGAFVAVTMGGEAITDEVYKNGVITIPSVTGNVLITVRAKEMPSYSVSSNLNNVTVANGADKVTAGEFFSANISWPDGYALNNITITMGGVDITADVYGEGKILITEVTGDVVITAEAALPPAVFTLSAPIDLGGEIVDTGFAPFAKVGQINSAFSICIDLSITAVANAAYKDFVRVAGLFMQYYGWNWRVFWNSGTININDSAGNAITGNSGPNGKFIITKEATSSSLTVYHHSSDISSLLTPTGQGEISDDTLKFNINGTGIYSGSISEFVWYDRALTMDEIKAYFGEV